MSWISKIFDLFRPEKQARIKVEELLSKMQLDDPGIFAYVENGFTFTYGDINVHMAWEEITRINVYKIDLMTVDRTAMEIERGDRVLTINEELPGWFLFTVKLQEVFPSIPKDWDITIIHPAFERNYRTIYERDPT